jgi:hypothetical protein
LPLKVPKAYSSVISSRFMLPAASKGVERRGCLSERDSAYRAGPPGTLPGRSGPLA